MNLIVLSVHVYENIIKELKKNNHDDYKNDDQLQYLNKWQNNC